MVVLDVQRTAEAIKRYRKDNHYTVNALAEELNISPNAIYKWERGNSVPTVDHLVELVNLYECDLMDLMCCNII